MDKPALGYTNFGKVNSPLVLGLGGRGKRWGGARVHGGAQSQERGQRRDRPGDVRTAFMLSSNTIWAI